MSSPNFYTVVTVIITMTIELIVSLINGYFLFWSLILLPIPNDREKGECSVMGPKGIHSIPAFQEEQAVADRASLVLNTD